MKRIIIFVSYLLFFLAACEKDRSPTKPEFSSKDTAEAKITFASNRDDNYEVYIMDADGSNPLNLTNRSDTDDFPSWSPDGSQNCF